MKQEKHSIILDYFRGLCAFAVVLGHSRFLSTSSDVSMGYSLNFLEKLVLLPTSFAEEAVAVFFLISGFLVGHQTFVRVRLEVFSWKKFLIDRISRFWTVLIPGLLITHLILQISPQDRIGNSKRIIYEAMCNSLFLMPTRCKVFQDNNSLWSLGYEFYFYILFALIINLYFVASLKMKGLYFLCTVSIVYLFGPRILILFPAWLLGFAINIASHNKRVAEYIASSKLKLLMIISSSFFFIPNILDFSQYSTILFCSFSISPLFLILVTKFGDSKIKIVSLNSVLIFMGKTSFSIYLFHVPIIQLIYRFRIPFSKDNDLFLVYGIAFIALCLSSVFYFFFEKYTLNIRKFLSDTFI